MLNMRSRGLTARLYGKMLVQGSSSNTDLLEARLSRVIGNQLLSEYWGELKTNPDYWEASGKGVAELLLG